MSSFESTSSDENFNIDEWENEFSENCPELTNYICFLDQIAVDHLQKTKISKKQQKRDRIARLEGMVLPGRTVMEKPENVRNFATASWKNVLERMEQFEENTPLGILTKAVKLGKRIEIRTHNYTTIDRIVRGIPTAFDSYVNCVLRNATELRIAKCPSKSQHLPQFLRWNTTSSSHWPLKLDASQKIESRKQRACFVKGDNVVLVRIL